MSIEREEINIPPIVLEWSEWVPWDKRLRSYVHPNLLIVGDFCLKELSPQDWYPLFPNPVLTEATLDRIINRSHHLILKGVATSRT
jgi:hypothetical protein